MDKEPTGIDLMMKEIPIVNKKLEHLILNPLEENIFVLGVTGSGKSSLICYLSGGDLEWKKVSTRYHIRNSKNGNFPEIGNDNKSCTDIPGAYGKYIDSAGFLDTKGPQKETINSYATAKLFKRGSKTKIVVVIEFSSLGSARGKTLVDVANRLYELFPSDFSNLVQSIVLVVSKVNTDEDELDCIIDEIKDIVSKNENISPQAQIVMRTLVEKKSVILFPLPKFINPGVIQGIKNKIEGSRACVLSSDASVSLSQAAKLSIDKLAAIVVEDMKGDIKYICQFLNKKYRKQYGSIPKIQDALSRIRQAKGILKTQDGGVKSFMNFSKLIELEEEIQNRIQGSYEKVDFCRTLSKQVKISINIVDKVVSELSEIENTLATELKSLATKQQIEKINKQHKQRQSNNQKQYQNMIQQMMKQSQENEKEARNALAEQQKTMMNQMHQSSLQYQQQITELNAKLVQIASRPPKVIHEGGGGGGCSIM